MKTTSKGRQPPIEGDLKPKRTSKYKKYNILNNIKQTSIKWWPEAKRRKNLFSHLSISAWRSQQDDVKEARTMIYIGIRIKISISDFKIDTLFISGGSIGSQNGKKSY